MATAFSGLSSHRNLMHVIYTQERSKFIEIRFFLAKKSFLSEKIYLFYIFLITYVKYYYEALGIQVNFYTDKVKLILIKR